MKRLIIYAYDNDYGVAGDATVYLLEQLKNISDRLVVVCNAYLTQQGRSALKAVTGDVYCLNCENLIPVLYADAIVQYLGMDEVQKYDEIILMDDSFIGPFWPLGEIFKEMEKKQCDYWVMYSGIPVQSFSVLRNHFVKREVFRQYLNKLLNCYRRSFQHIGSTSKYYPIDISSKNIYDGMLMESYIEDIRKDLELTEVDRQIYLLSKKKYPFLNKDIFEVSYWDMAMSDFQYDLKKVIYDIKRDGRYDFQRIENERELLQEHRRKRVQSDAISLGHIYIDYGRGYSEENVYGGYYTIDSDGDFQIRFSINTIDAIVGFRYDPLEEMSNCAIKIYSCKCDGKDVPFTEVNCIKMKWNEGYQVFATNDPYYIYKYAVDGVSEIIITGNILLLTSHFVECLGLREVSL